MVEIAEEAGGSASDASSIRKEADAARFLEEVGRSLSLARCYYERAGREEGALAADRVPTGFTALSTQTIDRLAAHASWQIYAAHAVYGPLAWESPCPASR